jgi:hypothetical protein
MATKVIIDKESKKLFIDNISTIERGWTSGYFTLIFNVVYNHIDIVGMPNDILNIINEYYSEQFNIKLCTYFNRHTDELRIFTEPTILLNKSVSQIVLSIKKINKYIILNATYTTDGQIIGLHNIYPEINYNNPNLYVIINHYMKEKYKINNYIPHIINNGTNITSIEDNTYQFIKAYNESEFSVQNIKINDELLFEILSSLINEMTKYVCNFLNEKN